MKRIVIIALAGLLLFPGVAYAHKHHKPAYGVKAPEGAWPRWGNESIGDCGFAAAADWEWMTQSVVSREAQLISEFHEAGGTDTEGLTEQQLDAYWIGHGISGVKASLVPEPASKLELLIKARTAVLARVRLTAGEVIGPVTVTGGWHFLLVDGYNHAGPEVTTWGETSQITWAQWKSYSAELYLPEVQS